MTETQDAQTSNDASMNEAPPTAMTEGTNNDAANNEDASLLSGGKPPAPEAGEGGSLLGGDAKAEGGDGSDGAPAQDFNADPFSIEDLKIPEGMTMVEGSEEGLAEAVNSATSKAEVVNNLLEFHKGQLEAQAELQSANWDNMQKEWQQGIQNDPEYGGDRMAESLGEAKALVNKYGGEEFAALLNVTGMGNHVAMLRFMQAIRADLPQDALPVAGDPTQPEKSLADKMFGA